MRAAPPPRAALESTSLMAVRPVPTGSASDRPCLCLRMAAIGGCSVRRVGRHAPVGPLRGEGRLNQRRRTVPHASGAHAKNTVTPPWRPKADRSRTRPRARAAPDPDRSHRDRGSEGRSARARRPQSHRDRPCPGGDAGGRPAAAPVAAPAATEAKPTAAHPGAVTSPMVGTAYRRPSPDAKPFVEIGSVVKQGERLLLVEAMKTFNDIMSPRAPARSPRSWSRTGSRWNMASRCW